MQQIIFYIIYIKNTRIEIRILYIVDTSPFKCINIHNVPCVFILNRSKLISSLHKHIKLSKETNMIIISSIYVYADCFLIWMAVWGLWGFSLEEIMLKID